MKDPIERADAIAALDDEITITGTANAFVVKDYVQRVLRKLRDLPSAQPTQTNAESTQKWQKDFREYIEQLDLLRDDYRGIMEYINEVPAAQPPLEEFEWCTDCKEYDQKAHCCHRFTKVIRQTVEELKVVRCKDCIHNNNCEIQYAAQTNDWFYCGYGERGKKNGFDR